MRKLNIHFTVDDATLKYCRKVSAGLREITDSIIVFEEHSPMIPHITLVMGELDEHEHSLEELAEVVRQLLPSMDPIIFHVHPPYLDSVVHKYVFSDIDGGEVFLYWRTKFKRVLSGNYLKNTEGSYGEQPPHLTLGHIEDKQEEVEAFLEIVKTNFSFRGSSIEISDVGLKGTCINSLYYFNLCEELL